MGAQTPRHIDQNHNDDTAVHLSRRNVLCLGGAVGVALIAPLGAAHAVPLTADSSSALGAVMEVRIV
ncbi:MAG: hypothetical protein VXY73_15380 [Pseudomonadota bacterium]|jgi:hypothetical protein|nr:hypothetical protein [Pseudomonadota bacterium]